MSDLRNAEQSAAEFKAVWAEIGEPFEELWPGLTGTVLSVARDAFKAGAASRQGEVDFQHEGWAAAEEAQHIHYARSKRLAEALQRLLQDTEGMVKSWETFNGFDRLKASWEAALEALRPEGLREGDSNVAMGEFES